MNKPKTTSISLTTSDGYKLVGQKYSSTGAIRGNIVLAGATGVPQGFYRKFASYAVAQGFNVLTFDYRGIAQSKQGDLKDLDMSYLDWGQYDAAAAVDAMYEKNTPLFLVGHSFGGHALGLLPNHHLLSAAYSFGTGAGWAGWMEKKEAIKVRILWNFILPILVKWKGYMAWNAFGMGEDLPIGVYRDWKKWCSYPNYFFDIPEFEYLRDKYAEISIPFVSAISTDDLWATPKSRYAFCKHYINCELEMPTIVPEPGQTIGHMGYFREDCVAHWDNMLQWFTNY